MLDEYFNGQLSPEEAKKVRERAAADPEFGAEFALREQMEKFPKLEQERAAFLATLRAEGEGYFQGGQTGAGMSVARNNLYRWAAAAAAVALLAVAVWFMVRPSDISYERFAQHAPLSLSVRGGAEDAKMAAETAFAQKNYASARAALERLLSEEPENVTARLYLGICLLEMGDGAGARAIFEPMSAGSSALREDAVWYLALSYLRERDYAGCRAVVQTIEAGQAHYEEAQELAAALPR
jgi:Thioredoxin domain-containing protein